MSQSLDEIIFVSLSGVLFVVSAIVVVISMLKLWIGDRKSKPVMDRQYLFLVATAAVTTCLATVPRVTAVILFNLKIAAGVDRDEQSEIFLTLVKQVCLNNQTFVSLDSLIKFSYIGTAVLYSASLMFIYLTYYDRLLLIFNQSLFEISNKQKCHLNAIGSILFILCIISTIVGYFTAIETIGSIFISISGGLLNIVFLFGTIYLAIIMFKQFNLIINIANAHAPTSSGINTRTGNDNGNGNDSNINGCESCATGGAGGAYANSNAVYGPNASVLIRLTVLTTMIVITSVSGMILFILSAIIGLLLYQNYSIEHLFNPIVFILTIDSLLNIFCLFLQFHFYDYCYVILCQSCQDFAMKKYENSKFLLKNNKNNKNNNNSIAITHVKITVKQPQSVNKNQCLSIAHKDKTENQSPPNPRVNSESGSRASSSL